MARLIRQTKIVHHVAGFEPNQVAAVANTVKVVPAITKKTATLGHYGFNQVAAVVSNVPDLMPDGDPNLD